MDFSTLISIAKPYIASTVRHAASAGAAALVTHGVIAASAEAQDAQVIAGIALGGMAQAWSWWQKHHQAVTTKAVAQMALNTGAQMGVAAVSPTP